MSRIDRLQLLLERFAEGEQTKLASLIGKSRQQISHWFTGYRPIGEQVARDIEIALGLPRGWLDDDSSLPDAEASNKLKILPEDGITLEQTLSRLGDFLITLEPEKHEGFIALLKLMMTNPKNELYPTMLAQLFPQSKSAFVSKRITQEQQHQIGNLEKPSFVK